jgi:hypothetical protein
MWSLKRKGRGREKGGRNEAHYKSLGRLEIARGGGIWVVHVRPRAVNT